MTVYLAFIDWPYGMEPVGVFSSVEKAEAHWQENYEGKPYSAQGKYTRGMLNLWEFDLDEGDKNQ